MSGCDWQKKSFTVSVSGESKLGNCLDCNNPIVGVIYKHNGDVICKDCYSKRPSLRKRLGISDLGFHTTRDKLYEFDGFQTFREHIQITGKRHWKRELKRRGLHDDVDYRKPQELKLLKEEKPTDRKWIADEIKRELQEKGLSNKLIRRK